jgi:hypothetical protein
MALEFTTSYMKDTVEVFRYYKRLAERAMEQAPDAALFAVLDRESNSIAIVVKHLSGNMLSRWSDFLTSDGEKLSRNRDDEFEAPVQTRSELTAQWEAGWECLFNALGPLHDDDLGQTITIRGEAHSVLQAIQRNLTYHLSSRLDRLSGQASVR